MINTKSGSFKKNIELLLLNGVLVALTCASVVFITQYHLNSSREFYFWDSAGYHNILLELKDRFHTVSKLDLLRDLYHSFSDEISNLFAVPLLPFVENFGESRFVFVLAMAFCYLLPTIILVSWFCSRLVESKKLLTFWTSAFFLLLSPFCWRSILDGRPDIGGVGLVLLAVILFVFISPGKKGLVFCGLSGVLLAMSLLFRRHFILVLPPFLGAAFVLEIFRGGFLSSSNQPQANATKKEAIVRILILGLSTLVTLVTLGRPFLSRYFDSSLREIYSSYEVAKDHGVGLAAMYFISFFGALWWLLSGIGIYSFFSRKRISSEKLQSLLFLILFSAMWILVWIFIGFSARHNYAVTIFWLFPIGCLGFISILYNRFNSLLATKLTISFLSFIALIHAWMLFGSSTVPKYLFPEGIVPVVRSDYGEMVKLVKDLQQKTNSDSPILVAGSSGILNEGILIDAETQLMGRKNRRLKVMGILHADSYKHVPIQEILKAEWVIVPTPFQWHIRPDVQQCVEVLHDVFINKWEISSDFEMLPEHYLLSEGVNVYVFLRVRKTNDRVAKLTEVRMRNRILKILDEKKT